MTISYHSIVLQQYVILPCTDTHMHTPIQTCTDPYINTHTQMHRTLVKGSSHPLKFVGRRSHAEAEEQLSDHIHKVLIIGCI